MSGLRARGGIGVDLEWKDGKLVKAMLTPMAAKSVKVRYAGKEKEVQMKAGQAYTFGPVL